jgi:hypothetical protein
LTAATPVRREQPQVKQPPPIWSANVFLTTATTVLAALVVYEVVKVLLRQCQRIFWIPRFGGSRRPSIFEAWTEQCDIYLQISTFSCRNAVKLYLGSILGPPLGIVFERKTALQSFYLKRDYFKDTLYVEWGPIGFSYQDNPFPLPEVLPIYNPWLRRRMRKFEEDPYTEVISNICVLYNNQLMVRPTGKANVGVVKPTKAGKVSTYFSMTSDKGVHGGVLQDMNNNLTPSAPPPAYPQIQAGTDLAQPTPRTYCINCQACDAPNLTILPKEA